MLDHVTQDEVDIAFPEGGIVYLRLDIQVLLNLIIDRINVELDGKISKQTEAEE